MNHLIDQLNFTMIQIGSYHSDLLTNAFIQHINRAAENLLGYSSEMLINQPLARIFTPNPDTVGALLDTGIMPADFCIKGELITQDQRRLPVICSTSPLSGQQGHNTNTVLLMLPINPDNILLSTLQTDDAEPKDCIAIESALAESEQRFRQMAEMTGEWLWEQDPNGYYLYSSNAVQQILGYPPADIIGRHYTEFLTPQDKANQQIFSASNRAFYALINHYQHKNGQSVLTESTGLPIINAQGKLLKWRGVDRDITARMHFENELIESEQRIRLIIESSMNAIILMDSYGIITDWNPRAEIMFDWTQQQAIGQRLDDLIIPPRFRNAHRQGLQVFLQTGVSHILNRQTEQIAMRKDGTEFPVELSVSPLKVGNAYIFSGFIHDISGRKAAEQQIHQSQIKLAIAQNEIRIAQHIQTSLSPSAPLKSATFEVTGFCLPADKVGGDYFDYFLRNENQLDMVIADVSGHAIGPALFMVETRSALRAQSNVLATPSEILGVLNTFLFNDLDRSDYFISLFYLQVDTHNQNIKFANAGHPPALLFKRLDNTLTELDADGLILGVRQQLVFEEKTLALTQGDTILFYTDGLTEAENSQQEFFGLARVKTVFLQNIQQPPAVIIEALLTALRQFCQREIFTDDITLMVFKYFAVE